MSDLTLLKRIGAGLATFAVAGGLVLAGSGVAMAHDGEDHSGDSSSSHGGDVPGKDSQPKDKSKIHGLVSEKPVEDLAKETEGTPAENVTGGLDHHFKNFHSVSLPDYIENNAEDPDGYSVGTHLDMAENMLGEPHAFDDLQEKTGTTPKKEFQEQDSSDSSDSDD